MDKLFYLQDFQGLSGGSSISIDPIGKRLPNQPCKFAMLSNWNITDEQAMPFRPVSGDNLVDNAGFEVYYGFNGIYIAQLMMGHSTELLPISNLNQICVRTRPSQKTTVWFAWFY